jgi:hypothetical protein
VIWSACREFNILPPGFKSKYSIGWDELETPQRATLLAYHQTAEHERIEKAVALLPKYK